MADVLIKEWDVGALRRPATNAPSASRTAGTNFPWDALNFDNTTAEAVYGFGSMPESDLYAAGGDIKIEIAWVSDGSTTGTVRWRADILGRVDGESWDVAFSDTAQVSDARTAADTLHVATITIGSTPSMSPGDDFILKISRDPTHGEDNYGADADLVRVRMYASS